MHEPYLPYVPQALQNIWVHVLLGTRGWIQAKGVGEGSGEIRALLAEYREVLQTADIYYFILTCPLCLPFCFLLYYSFGFLFSVSQLPNFFLFLTSNIMVFLFSLPCKGHKIGNLNHLLDILGSSSCVSDGTTEAQGKRHLHRITR